MLNLNKLFLHLTGALVLFDNLFSFLRHMSLNILHIPNPPICNRSELKNKRNLPVWSMCVIFQNQLNNDVLICFHFTHFYTFHKALRSRRLLLLHFVFHQNNTFCTLLCKCPWLWLQVWWSNTNLTIDNSIQFHRMILPNHCNSMNSEAKFLLLVSCENQGKPYYQGRLQENAWMDGGQLEKCHCTRLQR